MNENTKTLLGGGYCFSIKDSGPFVIGEDFEAPGPEVREIPRVKIDNRKWDELWSFVEQGAGSKPDDDLDLSIFEDATKRLNFGNGVDQALSCYVSEMWFHADIPNFRKQLQKLSKTVKQFGTELPKEFYAARAISIPNL